MNCLNIHKKLMVVYFVAFFVPVVFAVVILTGWVYSTLQKGQIKQAEASLNRTASLMRDMMQNAEKLSDSLFINTAVRETLARHFYSTREVYERYLELDFLDDFLRANIDVSHFRYYTENWSLLDNAYFGKATMPIRTSDWYIRAKKDHGKLSWEMTRDSVSRCKMLSLSRAVLGDIDGQFLGVLVLFLDTDRISRLLATHDNETFIAVNGHIEFNSEGENGSSGFVDTVLDFAYGQDSPVKSVQSVKWNGRRAVALMEKIYREQGFDMTLVQVIPASALMQTTFVGVFRIVFIMVLGLSISLILLLTFAFYFAGRVHYINNEINKVVQNEFELGPRLDGTDEFVEIYDALSTTSNNIKKLIAEVYQHKIEQEQLLSRQNDIRFKMLASQINPHFLFNTLETIRMQSLADGNGDVARTIKLLAKILRHNLDVTDRPVLLSEEIEDVTNYLDIQHLRFADRISYDIIFMCDVSNVGILPLLIQPLVENSFSHGLEARKPGGFINVIIDGDGGDGLYITIKDNGCGMSEEKLAWVRERLVTGRVETFTSSIGMVNVNQRIKLFYGESYGMQIESVPGKGTSVTIHVPKVYLGKC